MTATEPPDTMTRMTHAQQHAIFSRYSWTTDGKIRVRATHSSEPLLKLAGIHNPVALEYYNLPATRDGRGFLILNQEETSKRPPVSDSDSSLFAVGGIFSGGDQGLDPHHEVAARNANGVIVAVAKMGAPARTELASLCELPATRTFEIVTGPGCKLRFQVIAFEDAALPSPNEREQWRPAKPTDPQIREVAAALHLSRRLSEIEQL